MASDTRRPFHVSRVPICGGPDAPTSTRAVKRGTMKDDDKGDDESDNEEGKTEAIKIKYYERCIIRY